MPIAAQLFEETEDDSDRWYPVAAAAGNSTPAEVKKTTLPRQKILHGTLSVPFDLSTFEPKVYSEWEPLGIGGFHLRSSSVDKLGAENCTECGFLEGVCADITGSYLKGVSFGKLAARGETPAYPIEWGLLGADGQAIWIGLSKLLGTEELILSPMTVAATMGTQQQLPVSERLIISAALERLSESVAEDRTRALKEASQAIHKTGIIPEAALFAIQMLLNSKRSRRVDDATDLLSFLGRDTINTIAYVHSLANPPDGTNDDFWYALIRAAGHTGDRSLADHFLGSRYLALQEASVVAIGDVGDGSARDDLRKVAEDTKRSLLIRELAEELASDLS
jgi:hypothetical protein